MRVTADATLLEVAPGATTALVLEVVNNGAVIDGVSARVIGLPEECVKATPALLPLFPDASGQITLSLAVPPIQPAGRQPLTVEVVSHGARVPSEFVDVDLDVGAHPALTLQGHPRMIRARRSGRFVLELVNEGNVPIEVNLHAVDADRSTNCRFTPDVLRLEAGAAAAVLLTVRGPRMFTGGELDRTVTVGAEGRRLDIPADTVTEERLVRDTTVRLRQRPLISRGLLTAGILASIIALWAGVFMLGLTKVFSTDPMTKEAPASFFAASKVTNDVADTGAGVQPAPAGALPKTGQVPPGVGGEISGRVTAVSDTQPVGRILVQAVRISPLGPKVVSSAATLSDGTYTIAGLFPTSYYLKFSATGFQTVWYPAARTGSAGNAPPGTATLVPTAAQGTTTAVNAVIAGLPASISGTVDPGETLRPVVTTVTARAMIGGSGRAVATTRTSTGKYTLRNLPAPGTYQLTFTAPSYEATTLVDSVSGGDARLEPTVILGAATGVISGTVTDGTQAIGGATVSTTVQGKPVVVTTPTTGQVGAFVLTNLPTPATYVITFSAPGHGSETKIVDLKAGESRSNLDTILLPGTGSVSGRVVDRNGNGVGGVTITVGGATTPDGTDGEPPSTTTLTSGVVGSFAINGLATPGSYTLTATRDGYVPATVPFTLDVNSPPPNVTIKLLTQLGNISGRVSGSCPRAYCAGAVVTATDGTTTWTATVSGPGGALPAGGYLITGLLPGTYSVTVSMTGMSQQTAMVVVTAGATTRADLRLGG